jgi:NAD(P)-dependent dehydrogenase (short-subunit alcohol dehydrogenase family)
MSDKVMAVLGVGPGLGLSIARRFAKEGYTLAMVSRTDARHESYRAAVGNARTYTADLTDQTQLLRVVERITTDLGPLDTVYFGPAAAGTRGIVPLTEAGPDDVREPIDTLLIPAATLVSAVLPAMLERAHGTILLPGGLSGLRVMPMLGNLAPASAALRMYALTLHAALAGRGVYVGALTIGGLITGGDIHELLRDHNLPTLDPDEIADTAWRLTVERTEPEAVFAAL